MEIDSFMREKANEEAYKRVMGRVSKETVIDGSNIIQIIDKMYHMSINYNYEYYLFMHPLAKGRIEETIRNMKEKWKVFMLAYNRFGIEPEIYGDKILPLDLNTGLSNGILMESRTGEASEIINIRWRDEI